MAEAEGYLAAPLATFLEAVASVEPTPGGGAVAALAVAMSAALVSMSARLAGDAAVDAAEIESEAGVLRERAGRLAIEDAASFAALLRARRRPKDDPNRAREVEAALDRASEIPLEVTAAARRVNELANLLARSGNPNLRGDAATAAQLSAAAARAGAGLVALNLAETDDPRVGAAAELAARCELPT